LGEGEREKMNSVVCYFLDFGGIFRKFWEIEIRIRVLKRD